MIVTRLANRSGFNECVVLLCRYLCQWWLRAFQLLLRRRRPLWLPRGQQDSPAAAGSRTHFCTEKHDSLNVYTPTTTAEILRPQRSSESLLMRTYWLYQQKTTQGLIQPFSLQSILLPSINSSLRCFVRIAAHSEPLSITSFISGISTSDIFIVFLMYTIPFYILFSN